MSKAFYLTTPLYYVNDVPHVGHVYTTVIGDAIARYKRMCGLEVCYLTGTDEHGLKIERAAHMQGVTPQTLTDKNAAQFEQAWNTLGIQFDEFIRTTQPRHYEAVFQIFEKIRSNGFIYLGEYSGNYCVRCESYVPEGVEICPDCGSKTEFIKEESYFFKLSAFREKLLNFYADNPDFVIPQSRQNEIVSFVKGGLKDFSISRTSFNWGIPVPEDKKHIFYVWFDALNGYLSGIGYGADKARFEKLWPAGVQLMGKDILRFHGVYWPALLMAAGLEPPRHILAHGWWTRDGEKMSKSLGNFITAEELSRLVPPDYIRYFLLREIALGSDGNFSFEALLNRINSDLANDLGNLASRIVKMIENYFDGKLPEPAGLEGGEEELVRFARETIKLYRENFDKLQISRALENVWELISVANKYIVANEPWALARDPQTADRLATVLFCSAETLRIVAILLGPILPDGTSMILKQLGVSKSLESHRFHSLSWGGLKPGTSLGQTEAVYPRMTLEDLGRTDGEDTPAAPQKAPPPSTAPAGDPKQDGDRIKIDDFSRVEMRVGKILEAERVPKSDKLLRLQVDIGSEKRQVVAGIGKAYDPEGLVGRLVAVVTNLEPARLMGVESNGMIIAASVDGRPVLTTFTEPVEIGARLR